MENAERQGLAAPVGAAASSSAAVLACAACCVLPLAWPAVGLVLTGGVIAWLESAQPVITALAAVPVAFGWWLVLRQSRMRGKRMHPLTIPLMGAATALLVIAIFWPDIEPHLIRALEAMSAAEVSHESRP